MNSNQPLSLKRKGYTSILPVLTYGFETWHLTKEQDKKLESAQKGMEKKMLGITMRKRKQTIWIREQKVVEDVLIKKRGG